MKDSIAQLENYLIEQACEIVPIELKASFEHDLSDLASATRKQIESKRGVDPSYEPDLKKEVKITLEDWAKERLNAISYFNYKILMEKLGKKPVSKKRFFYKNLRAGSEHSVHDCFEQIEKKGIKIGSKVSKTGVPSTVLDISIDCRISVGDENDPISGSATPFVFELLEK